MSQLPSTVFEGGSAPGVAGSTGFVQSTPRIGIQGAQLATPGLVATPPVSRSANQLSRLLVALDSSAGLAQAAIGAQLQADEQLKGNAVRQAQEFLPQIQDDINNDRDIVPDGSNVNEYTDQIIESRTSAMTSPVGKKAFTDFMRPRISKSLLAQQNRHFIVAKQDGIRDFTGAVSVASTAGDISAARNESLQFNMTDEEFKAMVIVPAAQLSAQSGEGNLDLILSALDPSDPSDALQIKQIKALAADTERKQQQQQIKVQVERFNDTMGRAIATDNLAGANEVLKAGIRNNIPGQKLAQASTNIRLLKNRISKETKDQSTLSANQVFDLAVTTFESPVSKATQLAKQAAVDAGSSEQEANDITLEVLSKELKNTVTAALPGSSDKFDELASEIMKVQSGTTSAKEALIEVQRNKLREGNLKNESVNRLRAIKGGQRDIPFPLDQQSQDKFVTEELRAGTSSIPVLTRFFVLAGHQPSPVLREAIGRDFDPGSLNLERGLATLEALPKRSARRIARTLGGERANIADTLFEAVDHFPVDQRNEIIELFKAPNAATFIENADVVLTGKGFSTESKLDDLNPLDAPAAIKDTTGVDIEGLNQDQKELFNNLFKFMALRTAVRDNEGTLLTQGGGKTTTTDTTDKIAKITAREFTKHYVKVRIPKSATLFSPLGFREELVPIDLFKGMGDLNNQDPQAVRRMMNSISDPSLTKQFGRATDQNFFTGSGFTGEYRPGLSFKVSDINGPIIPVMQENEAIGFVHYNTQTNISKAFSAVDDPKTFDRLKTTFERNHTIEDVKLQNRLQWSPTLGAQSFEDLPSNVRVEMTNGSGGLFAESKERWRSLTDGQDPDLSKESVKKAFLIISDDIAREKGWPGGLGPTINDFISQQPERPTQSDGVGTDGSEPTP